VSLSEQAISFMAAAAAAYGPRALAPPSEAAPDTPETLGRGLLRMLPGDPVPLADFLASPGHAWFSVGKLLYRQGDLGRARSVLQRLIDSHDPDWSEPARFQLINVMREQDDIDGLRAAAAGAAETARPEAAYAFVVVGEMLEDRGDADGARAAYQQAIDADWEFADDLRDKLSPPAADDSEDEAPPADLPPRFHPDNITRTGLDVLDHGLPPLPEELSYHMAIPVAYWVARQCAVVLFLMFPRHGRRQRHPMILQATYSRTKAAKLNDL